MKNKIIDIKNKNSKINRMHYLVYSSIILFATLSPSSL